ncbi:MAG: nucleotide exchange factor GrpE [Planctomycetota bacterium]
MNETDSQEPDDVAPDTVLEPEAIDPEASEHHETSDEAVASVAMEDILPETRDEEMARLRGEVDMANKRVLQAQAEAENFRKRMRRDYEDQLRFASMPLVTDFLQVRDNLARAIDAAKQNEGADADGLTEGVAMVKKQMDDVLAKHGVTEIPAEGEAFDPNFHEAISQMPSPDAEPNQVLHVAASGWLMHDRVVRPAQVVVSAAD